MGYAPLARRRAATEANNKMQEPKSVATGVVCPQFGGVRGRQYTTCTNTVSAADMRASDWSGGSKTEEAGERATLASKVTTIEMDVSFISRGQTHHQSSYLKSDGNNSDNRQN